MPAGVFERTPEMRKKQSESMNKYYKTHNNYWKGKKQSEEHRRKSSEGLKRHYLIHGSRTLSKETKQKMKFFEKGHVPWNKGIPSSKKSIQKRQVSMKKRYPNGFKPMKGKTMSVESKQKMSESAKKRFANPEEREKQRQLCLGRKPSEEAIQKRLKTIDKKMKNPEYKAEQSTKKSISIKKACAKRLPKMSQAMKEVWKKPDHRVKTAQAISDALKRPEVRLKMSNSMKKVWADPEYKQRLKEITKEVQSRPETKLANSIRMKKLWATKEYRENLLKTTWNNPDYKDHQLSTNSWFHHNKARPTSIELLVQAQILYSGIYDYIPEYYIRGEIRGCFADFYVLPNLIIECDGNFYHSLLNIIKNDKEKNQIYKKHGYKLLRFTETDIHNNLQNIGNMIISELPIGGLV